MGDTKNGRNEQADNEEQRQRDREIAEARARGDEVEPPDDTDDPTDGTDDPTDDARGEVDAGSDTSRRCHRRGCDNPATFEVLERYQEETGHGAVEATAALCQEHTDEESPTNLDLAYEEYVFRVTPLSSMSESDTA